jgi:hypothetical protein
MTRVRTTSPMTRNQRRRSSEIPSEVKLRKVVPEVPQSETERGELLEDLQTMGCSGLLEKPWGFKDDQIVRELLDGVSNEFEHSIRATPVRWTEECWWEVYNFSKGGGGMARRKDKYVKDCFRALPSPKDRYAIEDCTDVRHRRVLAFLVPILYPEKPNQITVTMDNTIFGALNGGHVPLIPKVEKIPDTSSKDRFEHICNVLGEMQAEHRIRGELLREACQIVECTPSDLPDRIRKMVVEQFRVEDSKRLIEENARLNLEVGALINKNWTARMQAEAAVASTEKIQMFANQVGEVVAKAELFDEKVGI